MPKARRIGISMRVVRSEYGETRDALARDWPVLLDRLERICKFTPEWFLLPNIGEGCISLARRYGIQGLLLTGGDDIGATHGNRPAALGRRGKSARSRCLPGAQMLARYAGAALNEVQRERHVAARHAVA